MNKFNYPDKIVGIELPTYIRLSDKPVKSTDVLESGKVNIDYDVEGKIVGIEFI